MSHGKMVFCSINWKLTAFCKCFRRSLTLFALWSWRLCRQRVNEHCPVLLLRHSVRQLHCRPMLSIYPSSKHSLYRPTTAPPTPCRNTAAFRSATHQQTHCRPSIIPHSGRISPPKQSTGQAIRAFRREWQQPASRLSALVTAKCRKASTKWRWLQRSNGRNRRRRATTTAKTKQRRRELQKRCRKSHNNVVVHRRCRKPSARLRQTPLVRHRP